MYLLQCPHCNTIYKIVNKSLNMENMTTKLETDLGGIIEIDLFDKVGKCPNCGNEVAQEDLMLTEDWIADLLFKVKPM